jgi:hypothetical protein
MGRKDKLQIVLARIIDRRLRQQDSMGMVPQDEVAFLDQWREGKGGGAEGGFEARDDARWHGRL